jgi:hypothetical protein
MSSSAVTSSLKPGEVTAQEDTLLRSDTRTETSASVCSASVAPEPANPPSHQLAKPATAADGLRALGDAHALRDLGVHVTPMMMAELLGDDKQTATMRAFTTGNMSYAEMRGLCGWN